MVIYWNCSSISVVQGLNCNNVVFMKLEIRIVALEQNTWLSISILIYVMVLNSLDIHKKMSWEAVHQKSFFLITCKLVIRKKLVNNQMLNKNHLHCIDVIAYYCNKPVIFKKPRHGQLVIFSRKGGGIFELLCLKPSETFYPPLEFYTEKLGQFYVKTMSSLGWKG